jgi:hypothetical protein
MKKSRNHMLAWLNMTVLTVLIFSSCAKDHEAEIRELHRRYMEASMNHDIKTLSAMTAEDIFWQIGTFTLQGREEALGLYEYDAGTNNVLEYSNVVVHGDTVEFVLDEKNEIITVIGMEKIQTFPRYIFKDGLIFRIEMWMPSRDREEYHRLAQPMRSWISSAHPEAIERLFDSEKRWVFSRENGELMVQLARQWIEEKENQDKGDDR